MRPRKSSRKPAATPPDVAVLIKRITDAPDDDLVNVLRPIRIWKYLRGDMHSWLPVTKQLVRVLTGFRDSYGFAASSSKAFKLQLNEFTAKDKELIIEILGFLRLLMENVTSRKLFEGYEVLNDYLLTSDLDVLEATVHLLLRPLQQYMSSMPTNAELSDSIRQRLLALSRGWDRLHLAHLDLVTYASKPEALHLPEEVTQLQLQFYPTPDLSAPATAPVVSPTKLTSGLPVLETPTRPSLATKPSESRVTVAATPLAKIPAPMVETTMVTVDLGDIARSTPDSYLERLAATTDEYRMDIDDQLTAMNKIRILVHTEDREVRRKLLTTRLMALASYVIFSSEDAVQSNITLYEPELVGEIAELLVPGRDVGDSVVAAAVVALDAMSRHRPADVLTTISAHVSHGIIMNLLRSIAHKLSHGEHVQHDTVDAIFGFVSHINSLPTHGNLIIGAGLVPVLLEFLDAKGDRRLGYISRASGLLDSALYNHPQALPAFTTADGMNTLVNRVKGEVQRILDEPVPEPEPLESRDTIISYNTQAVKAELRSLYRMLQSTGGSEGFRNVVDTDLPKSIKRIFTNVDKFGQRNFAVATNIMATIVHNEPTSLSILQEMQVPQTFYEELNRQMPDSFEVIYTLPNAIGAICLNPAGLQATIDHFGVVSKLIRTTIGLKPEEPERDGVAAIGATLDELVRHHPSLRPHVLKAVLEILQEAINEGNEFRPSPADMHEYAVEPSRVDTSMEVESSSSASPADPSAPASNAPLTKITNILKLLTGLLRNSSMCRDFNNDGGLDLVLSIADLPCIPVRFSPTDAALAIPQVLRAIGEHDHIQLTERMVASVQQDLNALPELWKADDARDNWTALMKDDGSLEEHRRLRQAAGLAMRLSFLTENLNVSTASSQRTGTALIKSLGVKSGSDFVPNLGLLHRVVLQEHCILKQFNSNGTLNPTAPDEDPAPTSTDVPANTTAETSNTGPGSTPDIQLVDTGSDETADGTEKKTPLTRASTVKTLVTRMYAILIKFFKTTIRLIFNKRIPDAAHKEEAVALADCISNIIIGHLNCASQVPSHALSVDTLALGLTISLLFDERGHEGHLSTTLFIPFDKKDGLAALLANCRRIVAVLDRQGPAPPADGTVEARDQYARAHNGIRMVVNVLNAFASPRSLMESPQTHVIETREAALPVNKRFSPVSTFVRIRRDVFPIAEHIWMAEWLPTVPQPVLRTAVATFLDIMAGKNEQLDFRAGTVPEAAIEAIVARPTPQPRPQLTADPARVNQLVDMGFGRHGAERALLRARNNVAAAADLLLSMPHLFPDEAPSTPVPEASASATPAGEATSGATDAPTTENGGSSAPAEGTAEAEAKTSGSAAASGATTPTGEAAMDVDTVPSPTTIWEGQRAELEKLRAAAKPSLAPRALELLDRVEELVFDLLPAFPSGVDGADFIVNHIKQVVAETPRREDAVSSRLRLLSVFARAASIIELPKEKSKEAMDVLMSIDISLKPRPEWLAAFFLAIESVLLMTNTVIDVKIGEETVTAATVIRTVDFGDATERLIKLCTETLAVEDLTQEEVMAVMRLLVILTRHDPKLCSIDLMRSIFTLFKPSGSNLAGSHPLLAMIARHAFDDKKALRDIMRREIREWMNPARNKVTDVAHFVRQLRQMAYRDSDSFIDAVQDECELLQNDPPNGVYHIRPKGSGIAEEDDTGGKEDKGDDKMASQVSVSNDPFKSSAVDTFESNEVMDYLMAELGSAMRIIQQEEVANRAGTPYSDAMTQSFTYAGLILSIVTELVGSYFSAKNAFMASVRQGGLYGVVKGKSGIAAVINDLTCNVTLSDVQERTRGTSSPAASRRLNLSSWATSLVVALCAQVTPASDIKDVPEGLVAVRKAVLDGVAKALKDSAVASPDPGARYGRLWGLGRLVHRLLTVTPLVVPRPGDDSGLHLAKTMLEKNFVSIMTATVSEIDLNYPDIKNVLVSLLRALELLTKISIKWGKTDNKSKDGEQGAVEDDDEDSDLSEDASDISMSDEIDDEAPDLYRNSALGILGGDIDNDDDEDDMDEDEMDDEDDLLEAFGDEMDHDMDDDSGTEPSSDDDDDELDGDDEDMSGDEWDTEEEDEGEDGDHPDIHIADAIDDMGDPPVPWNEDGMMEGEEMDEEEFDTGDEGDDGFMENEFAMGFEMDEDEEDELEEFDDEEDGFDDGRAIMPGSHPGLSGFNDPSGHWGWQEPASRPSESSRLRDDAASSLFGFPPRQHQDTSQHPLLAGSRGVVPSRGRGLNSFGTVLSLQDLMSSVQSFGGAQAVRFLQDIVQSSRHSGHETLRVDLARDNDGVVGLSIGGRSYTFPNPSSAPRPPVTPEKLQAEYKPRPTMQRWQDEQGIFPYTAPEQISRIVAHTLNRLLPEAKARCEEDAKRKAKAAEEEEKQKKAEQEKEAAEAAAAAAAAPVTAPTEVVEVDDDNEILHSYDDVDMMTDEDDEDEEGEDESAVDPPEPRVTIMIHGEEVDITDTGIDLDFLQALPEDMRADVVEQHLREQNRLSQPAATNAPAASSQISPEFLNALPPDIRAEVIMQESLEHSRRHDQQDEEADVPVPRVTGLADLTTGMDAELDDLMATSRNLMARSRTLFNILGDDMSSLSMLTGSRNAPPSRPKRDAILLLEKPGIASLVRLLFFPETIKEDYLFRTLVHLCENSKTRVDLLNLLLSIVQDGSGDLPAVDRSFQQMSLKPLSTPKSTATPKGKVPETPAPPLISGLFTHLQTDHIPTFIAQRCFEALAYIVTANQQAVTYFLTEHEQPVGLKKVPTKKGKGKEKYLPQTKFPIVILIGLLDRPTLLKTPGMMESLTGLLAAITKPLASLQNQKEPAAIDNKPAADAASSTTPAQPAAATTAPEGTPATAADSTAVAASTSAEASRSKTPPLKAPLIPPSVLRLVVNGLTIGDCTSRTFSQTISVLQNLSCIPDAKDILVQELCTRSQQLGSVIQDELKTLGTSLADKDHEISPSTMSKFAPASSSQAQLLRLLKTIDYLHSRKADSEINKDRELTKDEQEARDIYRSFDFTNMWRQLSDCLTLAEERESIDQIAAVLLPLVEALMVVCKYTHVTPNAAEVKSPLLSPTTPPPTDLFLSFTTTHRKVLNAIVRNNPALMNGSFSLLIANPRVLEFDNKRNWFFIKLKRKRDQVPYGNLHMNVRRQYVFQDSYSALLHRPGEEVKYGKINVKFINEDGIDAGGVTREWYSVLAQQIFDPNFALFEPCAADAQTYQPNKHSSVVDDHLSFFKFVGRVIGKAIFDGRLLDAYFSRAFYKQILGRNVDMRDLESVDPEFHKSLQWMLDNDITDIIDQEFTIEDDSFGETKIVELKPGGATIPVTEENKAEYVRLVCEYRLEKSIKEQMNSFLTGFYEIIPRALIQIFEPDQLELLISGISTIDVDELKNVTQMNGWKGSDPEISWFWRALRSFSQEERSRFLMFVTSSSRVPLGGFSQLQGSSGIQPFQIQRLYGKEGILPQASTCFNLLLLPKYQSYEQLRERLLFAVTETSGFGKS